MLKPVLISALLLRLAAAQLSEIATNCTTPNGGSGTCNLIENCEVLQTIVTSLNEVDRVVVLYQISGHCAYKNHTVLICCPHHYHEATPVMPPSTLATAGNDLLPSRGQCGKVSPNRIIGANLARIGEFPWQARIEYTKPDSTKRYFCSGALISKRYVITAAQCVHRSKPADWRLSGVRLGEWDTGNNPDCDIDLHGKGKCAPPHLDVPIERAIPHPQFEPSSKNQANDIALLRLEQDVPYTDFVSPICLPVNTNLDAASFDGIFMDVAGWRILSTNKKSKAAVAGKNLDECRKTYSTQKISLENSHLCAGGEKELCIDSSGGPLMSLETANKAQPYYFLAGLVSFGPSPCGISGWPDVYTRVDHFVDWIHENVEP